MIHTAFAGLLALLVGAPALAADGFAGIEIGDGIFLHRVTDGGTRSISLVRDDSGWTMTDAAEEAGGHWELDPFDTDPGTFSRSHVETRLSPDRVERLLETLDLDRAMLLPGDERLAAVIPDAPHYRIEIHRGGRIHEFAVQAPRILAAPVSYEFPLRDPEFDEFEARTRSEIEEIVPSPVDVYLSLVTGIEDLADGQIRIAHHNLSQATE